MPGLADGAPPPMPPDDSGGDGEAVDAAEDEDDYPPVTRAQVMNCSFARWYPRFRRASIKSRIINLPADFVRHLRRGDGVFLPSESEAMPARQEGDGDAGDSDQEWDDEEPETQVPGFDGIEGAVRVAIDELEGAVVPKLNWSSPKDAVWINQNGSMKCTNPEEVLLMLQSSDNVSHDVTSALDTCVDAEGAPPDDDMTLVLRKWYDFRPSMEFRCFVKEHELLGVCQRDVANFYPFLLDDRDRIEEAILQFHDESVAGEFPDPDYVYDVYVTTDMRVKVVDFNPFGGSTLPLLFTWRELLGLAARCGLAPEGGWGGGGEPLAGSDVDLPVMRVVEGEGMLRPGLRVGVPFDMYDSSSAGAIAAMRASMSI